MLKSLLIRKPFFYILAIMKQIHNLLAVLLLFTLSCTQPDDAKNDPQPSNATPDQYFSFTITGDSFDHEPVVLALDTSRIAFFYVFANNGGEVTFRLTDKATMQNNVGGMTIQATTEGTYSFEEYKTTCGFYVNGKHKQLNIKSKTGSVTIDHFPDSLFDYLRGSFQGTFYNSFDTTEVYTITNGKIRFKRTT